MENHSSVVPALMELMVYREGSVGFRVNACLKGDCAQCFVGLWGLTVVIMGSHMLHKLLSVVLVLGSKDIENPVVS